MKLKTNWWLQLLGMAAQGAIAGASDGSFGHEAKLGAAVVVGAIQLIGAIKAHHSTVQGDKVTPAVAEAIHEKTAPALVASIAQQDAVNKQQAAAMARPRPLPPAGEEQRRDW